MKYVKTSDDRIIMVEDKTEQVFFLHLESKVECYIAPHKDYRNAIPKQSVIKVANTIEELLDEYVVIDGNNIATYKNLDLAKKIHGRLYGGILTTNGSICVAKFNNKKEWELLWFIINGLLSILWQYGLVVYFWWGF